MNKFGDNLVVIFSGGLDSTTMLYHAKKTKQRYAKLYALGMDYGQRHVKELGYARSLTHRLGVPFQVVDLTHINQFLGGSSQTDRSIPVPHGHFEDESMKITVVPNRNMIMLAMAIAFAEAKGGGLVWFGAHKGDHAIYPDCRPEFVRAIDLVAGFSGWNGCGVEAPFIDMTKTDIARLAGVYEVPVDQTWSCYEGGLIHCGKCGTCVERIEALRDAGVKDTTKYATAQTINAG